MSSLQSGEFFNEFDSNSSLNNQHFKTNSDESKFYRKRSHSTSEDCSVEIKTEVEEIYPDPEESYNSLDTTKAKDSSYDDRVVKDKPYRKFEKKLLLGGKFFTIVERLNKSKFHKDRYGITARCEFCKSNFKGSMHVTSNFLKHLKKVHTTKFEEYLELKGKNKLLSMETKNKTQQEVFDRKIISFIVDTMSPISIVEEKSFIDLFDGTNLIVMSKGKAIALLDIEFKQLIDFIKLKMESVNNFCTTADIWSYKMWSFFGYTCHWLDNNFKKHSVALAYKRFSGAQTHDRISNFISEVNENFGLNHNNITSTVTDNGSNFIKAFTEFGICVPDSFWLKDNTGDESNNDFDDLELPNFEAKMDEVIKTLPKQQRCASHTINLLATTDFMKILRSNSKLYNIHLNAIKTCSYLWNKAISPKSSEIIFQILGINLSYPIVTSWNSLYDSITNILSAKDKLNQLCTKLSIPKFSKNELIYLQEYKIIMGPIADTLNFLQSEKEIYFGFLIPSLVTLQTKLRRIYNSGSIILLKDVGKALETSLINRFKSYFYLTPEANDAIVASVLCPSVKLKWLSSLSKTAVDCSVDKINGTVLDYANAAGNNCSYLIIPKKETCDISFFDFGDEDTTNGPQTLTGYSNEMEREYYLYLADPNEDIVMLNKYPLMKTLFFHLNVTLTSPAPVERLFSFTDLINFPHMNYSSDVNFEKLVLMKANKFNEILQ